MLTFHIPHKTCTRWAEELRTNEYLISNNSESKKQHFNLMKQPSQFTTLWIQIQSSATASHVRRCEARWERDENFFVCFKLFSYAIPGCVLWTHNVYTNSNPRQINKFPSHNTNSKMLNECCNFWSVQIIYWYGKREETAVEFCRKFPTWCINSVRMVFSNIFLSALQCLNWFSVDV